MIYLLWFTFGEQRCNVQHRVGGGATTLSGFVNRLARRVNETPFGKESCERV
ncbi:hypothetical protein [Pandoraea cepalis]|uniref:hypothetical protein n=1 Tax=Pandoraea cepalis TaxID=2508294 RepID=UPI0015823196|nr:hypothetical protein [Pandoraea cepalis]